MPATTTDRSDERHAEAAGSVESHIESPTPSLAVLHPGAPHRHSQIRNTFRLASRRDWDRLKRDVKLIYTAPTEPAARAALDDLAEKWGDRYPAMIRLWQNAWAEFIPFLDYGACRRIA